MAANWRAIRKAFVELRTRAERPLRAERQAASGWYLVDVRPRDIGREFMLLAGIAATALHGGLDPPVDWRTWLDALVRESVGSSTARVVTRGRDTTTGADVDEETEWVSLPDVLTASARYCRLLDAGHEPKPPDAVPLNKDTAVAGRKRLAAVHKARVEAYIDEVRQTTGVKITNEMIIRSAGVDRAEFYRWQAVSKRAPTRRAVEKIERVLATKPHLKAKSRG